MRTSTAHAARVGLDFGMTIADMHTKGGLPFQNSLSTIRAIVGRHGPANVFIVSKAKAATQALILGWLDRYDFYASTGLPRNNVIFVREYADKREVVDRLGISLFIDDSSKVVKCLADSPSIRRVIWFKGRCELVHQLPKAFRNKIVFSKSWNALYKSFSKPRTCGNR